jgi:ABC-type Na+ transport system ATPase subunit NatA
MKILTGYLQASAGKALVADVDVSQHPILVKRKLDTYQKAMLCITICM